MLATVPPTYGTPPPYGKELLLDLELCRRPDLGRAAIRGFLTRLCELIDMKPEDLHFWDFEGDPEGYATALPHLRGVSAVQFIRTSTIVIHALDEPRSVYVNIFSCKDYDSAAVLRLASEYWQTASLTSQEVLRW